jgi:hypothetical protein
MNCDFITLILVEYPLLFHNDTGVSGLAFDTNSVKTWLKLSVIQSWLTCVMTAGLTTGSRQKN